MIIIDNSCYTLEMTVEMTQTLPRRKENPFRVTDLTMVQIAHRTSAFEEAEVASILTTADRRMTPLSPQAVELSSNIGGKPYRGPIFLQGDDVTCLGWAITHATYAVGETPDAGITASLLNTSLPSQEHEGGMYVPDAVILTRKDTNKVFIEEIKPLHEIKDSNGNEGTPQNNFEDLMRTVTSTNKALIAALAEIPYEGDNTEKSHSVCLTAFETSPSGDMQIQVIDSLTGPRVESSASLTQKILNAGSPMLTVARKQTQTS